MIKLRKEQIVLDNDGRQGTLIKAGRAWGKSLAGKYWLTEKVFENNGDLLVVAETLHDAARMVIENEILKRAYPGIVFKYQTAILPNGVAIHMKTYAEVKSKYFRGPRFNAMWFDEIRTDIKGYEWLDIMLSLKNNGTYLITTTPTPDSTKFLVSRVFDEKCVVITGSTYDNKHNLHRDLLTNIESCNLINSLSAQVIYGYIVL